MAKETLSLIMRLFVETARYYVPLSVVMCALLWFDGWTLSLSIKSAFAGATPDFKAEVLSGRDDPAKDGAQRGDYIRNRADDVPFLDTSETARFLFAETFPAFVTTVMAVWYFYVLLTWRRPKDRKKLCRLIVFGCLYVSGQCFWIAFDMYRLLINEPMTGNIVLRISSYGLGAALLMLYAFHRANIRLLHLCVALLLVSCLVLLMFFEKVLQIFAEASLVTQYIRFGIAGAGVALLDGLMWLTLHVRDTRTDGVRRLRISMLHTAIIPLYFTTSLCVQMLQTGGTSVVNNTVMELMSVFFRVYALFALLKGELYITMLQRWLGVNKEVISSIKVSPVPAQAVEISPERHVTSEEAVERRDRRLSSLVARADFGVEREYHFSMMVLGCLLSESMANLAAASGLLAYRMNFRPQSDSLDLDTLLINGAINVAIEFVVGNMCLFFWTAVAPISAARRETVVESEGAHMLGKWRITERFAYTVTLCVSLVGLAVYIISRTSRSLCIDLGTAGAIDEFYLRPCLAGET